MTGVEAGMRTDVEIAQMRAMAAALAGESEYMAARCHEVEENLRWVVECEPTRDEVNTERLRGESDEALMLRTGHRRDAFEAGLRGLVMSWVMCRPGTEPPLVG